VRFFQKTKPPVRGWQVIIPSISLPTADGCDGKKDQEKNKKKCIPSFGNHL
jgi:hypothetical protein